MSILCPFALALSKAMMTAYTSGSKLLDDFLYKAFSPDMELKHDNHDNGAIKDAMCKRASSMA